MKHFRYLYFFALALLFSCQDDTPQVLVSFEKQNQRMEASLRGVSAVSDSVCWASGSKGTVLRTTDGGKTWEKHVVPGHGDADFRDIHAFSDNKALVMAVGSPAKIFRTNNGGKSWWLTYFYDHPDIFLDGMDFWNEKEGLAFGDQIDGRIFIIKTTNGGNSWYPINEENMPAALEGEGGFAGSGTSIMCRNDSLAWIGLGFPRGRLLRSWDKGETWDFFLTGMGNGDSSRGVYSIDMDDGKNVIIAGGSWNKPVSDFLTIATSDDGGKLWNMVKENPPNGYRSCVKFVPGSPFALSTGTTGTSISYDKGENWDDIDDTPFNSLSFSPSGNAGWVVGPNGSIAKLIVSYPKEK